MNSTFTTEAPRRGIVTVSIEAADYEKAVKEQLRNIRQRMDMPGFRKGMVPQGIVTKKYGASVKIEEINKMVGDKLFETLRENNVEFLGQPMIQPNDQDLEKGSDFTFSFHLALTPDFNIPLSSDVKLPYYTVKVGEKDIDEADNYMRRAYGSMQQAEVMGEDDSLYGLLVELDAEGNPKENGLRKENCLLLPKSFKDEAEKAKFKDVALHSVVRFNPYKADGETDAITSNLLGIKPEEVEDHKGDFNFEVEKINHFVEAELGEELYKKAFGEETTIKDEAAYRAELAKRREMEYASGSNNLFANKLIEYVKANIGTPEFDKETFRPFVANIQKKNNEELTEESFQSIIDYVFFTTALRQMAKAQGVEVTDEIIRQEALGEIRQQMAAYGYSGLPDSIFETLVKSHLEDENKRAETELNATIRLVALDAQSKVTLEKKEVTSEEFEKLFHGTSEEPAEEA